MASPAPIWTRLSSGYHEAADTRIEMIVGLNEDGVFGATDEPAARHQTVVPLLWLKILELLGRVPEGQRREVSRERALPD